MITFLEDMAGSGSCLYIFKYSRMIDGLRLA